MFRLGGLARLYPLIFQDAAQVVGFFPFLGVGWRLFARFSGFPQNRNGLVVVLFVVVRIPTKDEWRFGWLLFWFVGGSVQPKPPVCGKALAGLWLSGFLSLTRRLFVGFQGPRSTWSLLGDMFPIFASCGLVVEIQIHLTAKICFLLPFQRQPSQGRDLVPGLRSRRFLLEKGKRRFSPKFGKGADFFCWFRGEVCPAL